MTDTPADLPHLAQQIASLIAEYHASLAARPVTPDTAPRAVYQALPDRAPEHPEAWDDILRDVNELILPNLTNWQSPDFFAYFPSNTTVPAMLADFLCAGLGVQGMLWSTSPAATELEMRTLDWLANIINLPKSF
ncbi:MAG: aspartate aminotransferase family protein, partial [Phycisphaerales bacterium]|nr:aspartate aminotransferase family protein [Phycisphaerales bacterium]